MSHADDAISNPSTGPSLDDVLLARYSRRQVLAGGLVAAGAALLGRAAPLRVAEGADDLIGFRGVPVSKADTVIVPGGYSAEVLYAWGDPVGNGPEFKSDASNTYADQERQAGMHHDGIHYFPLPLGSTELDARAPGDEPRVHGRRSPPPGRDGPVDAGEGGEVPGRSRRVGRRGHPGRGPLAGRPELGAGAPDHGADADEGLRAGGGARPHAHRLRPGRPDGAGHDQQLRHGRDALGDVSHLRGELQQLLRERRGRRARHRRSGRAEGGDGRPEAVRHRRQEQLPLERARRAVRRGEEPERVQPLRLDRGDRSLRPRQPAREAHGPRALQARGRVRDPRQRQPGGRVLRGRRAQRVRLQVRQHRALRPRQPPGEPPAPRAGHALRGPVQPGRHRGVAPAGARPGRARPVVRLRRARPRSSSTRAPRPTSSARPRWTGRSGSRCIPRAGTCTSR